VHEAFVRLVGQQSVDWRNRAHFFALASTVMRRILVDHARARLASKRGGGTPVLSLDELTAPPDESDATGPSAIECISDEGDEGDSDEDLVSTLIKSELAPLNINVQIESMAWPTQWAKGKSSNLAQRQDIFLFYWWPDYADPYSWFINIFKSENPPFFNLAYYSNAALDKTMNQAERIAASKRPRAVGLYRSMQATLLHDAPAIPLYVQVYQHTLQKGVTGFVDNPAYPNVVYVYDLKPTA